MHVYFRGMKIEFGIAITGISEVQSIDGSKVAIVHIEPILPAGPRGPGEPIELPRAA